MSAICGASPCPLLLSSSCVFYEGEDLLYIGVQTNDNLQLVIQKINQAFINSGIGYIFNNGLVQTSLSAPVQLGGSLIQNTTIGGNFTLTFAGNVQAAKHITTGGTSSQFVKGDGTLDSSSFQPPGNYITALSGDGVATGPGAVPFTLNTVNSNPGTFGAGSLIPVVTVNAKGLVTSLTTTPLVTAPQSITFIGDVFGTGFTQSTITLILQNVNPNPYVGITPLKFAVNAKGLVTAASPITSADIISILGYTPGTVSSIGISVPPAFAVSNSPITTSGIIGIAAIGTASQYIKGDGSLGTAPISTSGTAGTSGTSGSSGTTGTSGSSGTSGTTGTSGTAGTSGTSGTTGSSGSSGTSGSTGTSGSSGTTGTSGSSGTTGTSGSSGTSGTTGTSGSSGSSGTTGLDGSNGTSGTSGTTGTSGSSGTSGTTGTSGSSGTSGTTGTSGSSGLSGDRFATTSSSTYTLQAPGNSGTITVGLGLSFTVAQSIIIAYDANNHNEAEVVSYNPLTGALSFIVFRLTGSGTYSTWQVNLDGATGGDGSSGSSGTSGTSSTSGTSGTTGSSGSSGTSGTTGTSGSSGTSGTSATDGTGGTSGTSGTSSTSGSSGTSGTTGTSGSSGTSGTSATDGTGGTSGTSGSSGTSGTTGTSGTSATSGTSGTTGSSGTSGTSGSTGTSGSSGTSGANGSNGTSGTSGTTPVNQITGSGTTNYLAKFTGSTTVGNSQVFDNGTNVGINQASPTRTLDILGASGIGTVLKLQGASGTTTYLQLAYNGATNAQSGYIGYNSSSQMQFFTNDTLALTIDSNRNVGIGTASPTEKLDVLGVFRNLMPSDPLTGMITAKFLSYSLSPYGLIFRGYSSGVHSIQSQREGNDAQLFGLSLQPLGGNVLIGTTTDSGDKFQVNGTIRLNQGYVQIINTSNAGLYLNNVSTQWQVYNNTSNNFIINNGAGTTALSLTYSTGAATFSSVVTTKSPGNFRQSTPGAITGAGLFVTPADAGTYGLLIGSSFTFGDAWLQAGRIDGNTTNYNISLQASGGNVLIGTTTDNGARLQVSGAATISGNGLFGGATAFAGLAGGIAVNGSTNSGINFRIADVLRGYVYVAGNLGMYVESTAGNVVLAPTGVAALTATTSGNVGIGTASPQSGVILDIRGSGAVAGGSEGLRIGNVGDNSAYDNVKLWYTGFNGGSPRVYLTPRTTPGSGVINTFLHLLNTNGTSNTSNNTMGLIVDGSATANSLLVERTASRNMLGISSISLPTSGAEEGVAVVKTNSNLWQMSLVGYAVDSKGMRVYNTGGAGYTSFEVAQGAGTRFIVDGVGNVGIGTTSPGQKLVVQESGDAFIQIRNNTAGQNFFIGALNGETRLNNDNNTPITMWVNGSERMRITSGGNVGIGTTDTQTFRLAVDGPNVGQGDVTTTIRVFDTTSATTGTGGGISFAGYFSGTSSIINTFSYIKGGKENSTAGNYASYLSFGTRVDGGSATERMRITSGGNVLIGTTTDAGYTLNIAGNAQIIKSTTSTAMVVGLSGVTGSIIRFSYNGGFVGSISTDGSNTAYNTSSDYRLKQDIKDFNGLDLLSRIKTYDFEWKSDKTRSYGVLAHELQEVINYAVTGSKDAEEMQGVDYSKIVPILIKAIQELNEKIK